MFLHMFYQCFLSWSRASLPRLIFHNMSQSPSTICWSSAAILPSHSSPAQGVSPDKVCAVVELGFILETLADSWYSHLQKLMMSARAAADSISVKVKSALLLKVNQQNMKNLSWNPIIFELFHVPASCYLCQTHWLLMLLSEAAGQNY